jgi:DNA-binding beta-propeller fold protein YncE
LAVPGTRVYVADFPNNLVRVIDIADATVSIFEGTGAAIPTPPTRATTSCAKPPESRAPPR